MPRPKSDYESFARPFAESFAAVDQMFADEDITHTYLILKRWGLNHVCPHCQSKSTTIRPDGYFRCGFCRQDFTVRTGTVMERSHVSLKKWLQALHLYTITEGAVTSAQLATRIGATRKTGLFVVRRLQEALGYWGPSGQRFDRLDRMIARLLHHDPRKMAPPSEGVPAA
jgi:transposase-like protein